jgi:UDPglucose--hexose-1-phosphate uridylyltransferase
MNYDETFATYPHRRFNPLNGEWVLVSPHRAGRPWLGQMEKRSQPPRTSYDPTCYLCPGNERAGGVRNPVYTSTFVFDNDFAALLPDAPLAEWNERDVLVARTERGICRVVCFSPDHSLSVPTLPPRAMQEVVEVWTEQYRSLCSIPWVRSVQIFENRGEMMGASNPHPHCQIWANETIPVEVEKELRAQREYRTAHGSCLLCDYTAVEYERRERIVAENEAFLCLVPFWAVWPFETLIVPRRHCGSFPEMNLEERALLAQILQEITRRYDKLFDVPFPYTMGFHQKPAGLGGAPGEERGIHFHAHFYPPLLRSAEVRKFMVGYEMLANPQRDITAELAAERLRKIIVA